MLDAAAAAVKLGELEDETQLVAAAAAKKKSGGEERGVAPPPLLCPVRPLGRRRRQLWKQSQTDSSQ